MKVNLLARIITFLSVVVSVCFVAPISFGQQQRTPTLRKDETPVTDERRNGDVRSVTIPVTIRGERALSDLVPTDFTVIEDGKPQRVISVRNLERSPISIAILIQDDVISVNNELPSIKSFIRSLPEGSRVFVGYLRSGSVQVRQKFTTDLERAASSLRITAGTSAVAPYNPYTEVRDVVKRFSSLPSGRRAILLVSDGLDASRGIDSSSPTQSLDLDRAILEAQRRSVAVYSFFSPTASTSGIGSSRLTNNAQSSLQRLSDETGGRAFFQGTGAPVSFDPFLRDLNASLTNQFALTYLTTQTKNGYYKIKVVSDLSDIKITHPAGVRR